VCQVVISAREENEVVMELDSDGGDGPSPHGAEVLAFLRKTEWGPE
jgi:hypothetical protein